MENNINMDNRDNNDLLVDKILMIMHRKGITKVTLAKQLGMSKHTLSNYLLKHRLMPYEVAINIAKELNINISQLHNLSAEKMDEEEYQVYIKIKELINSISNK